MDELRALDRARSHAEAFLASLADRPVTGKLTGQQVQERAPATLPDAGQSATATVDELVDVFGDGLVASQGGRFFGYVVGGSLPAALAADWLTSAWDQNAGPEASSPAGAAVEAVVGRWVADLCGLPAGVGCGFVTGGLMGNVTALAAARTKLYADRGWDIDRRGLSGAPPVRVVTGADRHITFDIGLRYLGMGTDSLLLVETDDQERVIPEALDEALGSLDGPAVVALAAGYVNTGAFDSFEQLVPIARRHGAWVHVDGAFGLWAAASERTRHLLAGVGAADSWSVDGHKWLNVPYDSGLVMVRDPGHLYASMYKVASYIDSLPADPMGYVPEFSRRARGFTWYAALRSLGREGLADLVDRSCAHARQMASLVAEIPGLRVGNEVELNQVLMVPEDPAMAAQILRRTREDGTVFLTGTTWKGNPSVRFSVSGWRTTDSDIQAAADAVRRAMS